MESISIDKEVAEVTEAEEVAEVTEAEEAGVAAAGMSGAGAGVRWLRRCLALRRMQPVH